LYIADGQQLGYEGVELRQYVRDRKEEQTKKAEAERARIAEEKRRAENVERERRGNMNVK